MTIESFSYRFYCRRAALSDDYTHHCPVLMPMSTRAGTIQVELLDEGGARLMSSLVWPKRAVVLVFSADATPISKVEAGHPIEIGAVVPLNLPER